MAAKTIQINIGGLRSAEDQRGFSVACKLITQREVLITIAVHVADALNGQILDRANNGLSIGRRGRQGRSLNGVAITATSDKVREI